MRQSSLDTVSRMNRTLLRTGLPLLMCGLCFWLLQARLSALELAHLRSAVSEIGLAQWLLALVATAGSFWAVGRYDAVLHGTLSTGVPPRTAALSGASAIAISQLTGLGLVTGAFVRWRILPALPFPTAAALTALCAASFLVALGALIGAVHLLNTPTLWAAALTLACFLIPLASLFFPRLPLPPLRAFGKIFLLTALDTACAALAFWALLPVPSATNFFTLYSAFLLALGTALLSGAPAGLGPFELVLLTTLPQVPEADLLAALISFRFVYYALPACLGALALAWPQAAASRQVQPPLPPLKEARRAELGITRQNGAQPVAAQNSHGFALRTRQTLALLFDPLSGPVHPLLSNLRGRAARESRIPLLYKCSARTAAAARRAGFQVQRIAREAVLNPKDFTIETPACRQLRRKLRQAAKAGLTTRLMRICDLPALAQIDMNWQAERGNARGGSMGRFSESYIADQNVYVAEHNNTPVGFISFHTSRHQHCLDLLRIPRSAPSGTAHALVIHALDDAARADVPELSLAALPDLPLPKRLQPDGLAQFKASFAPQYQPLYAAAPNRLTLWVGLLDLALHILRPTPLRGMTPPCAQKKLPLPQPCAKSL